MADDGGFLRRWSRRKHEARQGREAEPAAVPAAAPGRSAAEAPEREAARGEADGARRAAVAGEHARPPAAATEADRPPVVPPESLPDIASLGAGSDFRAFMRPGVPPELRTQALRRLWRVKPLVRDPERFLDYDEDYTDAARVAKGLKTLYRVGRGVFTDEELAALDAERAGTRTAADDAGAEAPAAADAPAAAAVGADDPAATPPPGTGDTEAAAGEEVSPRPPAAPDATG